MKLDFTAVLPMLIPAFGKLKEPDIAALCGDEIDIPETIGRFAGLYRKPAEMFTERDVDRGIRFGAALRAGEEVLEFGTVVRRGPRRAVAEKIRD